MDTKALKQKILDLAIRGKLVPQDPNDEPASVLLEKIREEKQKMVAEGKLKAKDIKNDTVIFKGSDNLHYEKFNDGSIKCIEDEIPFELPEGWEWTRLQAICEPITDGTHKTPTYSDEGFIFLSSKNVTSGHIDWDNIMYIPESLHNELYARLAPQKNDILLAKNGTTGVAAIVDRDCIFDIYVSLALLRIIGYIISPEYLLSTIASSTIQNYFNSSLKGIGVPNLHLEHIRTTLIPVAPINEQYRIATKLEQLLSFADNIESDKDDLQTTIQLTKSKILDLAIRGKLVPQNPDDEPASVLIDRIRAEKEELIKQGKIKRDKKESVIFKGDDNSYYEHYSDKTTKCISNEIPFELPKNWSWCRIRNVSSIVSKGTTPKSRDTVYLSNEVNYLRIENIDKNGIINHNNIAHIDLHTHENELKRSILMENDLLISIAGTLGKTAIVRSVDLPMNTNQAIAFVRLINNKACNINYLRTILDSNVINESMTIKTKVTSIPNLTLDIIANCILPIPPLNEQQRIANKISQLFSVLDAISESLA